MTSQETQNKIEEMKKKINDTWMGNSWSMSVPELLDKEFRELISLIESEAEKREKEVVGKVEEFCKHVLFGLHWIHSEEDRNQQDELIKAYYADFLESVSTLPKKEEHQK